jgi:hypothetical protein
MLSLKTSVMKFAIFDDLTRAATEKRIFIDHTLDWVDFQNPEQLAIQQLEANTITGTILGSLK